MKFDGRGWEGEKVAKGIITGRRRRREEHKLCAEKGGKGEVEIRILDLPKSMNSSFDALSPLTF